MCVDMTIYVYPMLPSSKAALLCIYPMLPSSTATLLSEKDLQCAKMVDHKRSSWW